MIDPQESFANASWNDISGDLSSSRTTLLIFKHVFLSKLAVNSGVIF
jgi:hypothetical protein